MPENNPSITPEQYPIDNNLLQFHDALQQAFADPENPSASLQNQQERLRNIVDEAKWVLPGDLSETIEGYGDLVSFMWFGSGVVDEVPAECQYEGHRQTLQPLEGTMLGNEFGSVTAMLRGHGLDELIEERQRWFDHNKEASQQALRDYINTTPSMALLDSFRDLSQSPESGEAADALSEEAALNRFRHHMEEFMEAPGGGIYLNDADDPYELDFLSPADESWFGEAYPTAMDWVNDHGNSAGFSAEVTFLSDVLLNAYKPGVNNLSSVIEEAFKADGFRDFIGDFNLRSSIFSLEETMVLKQMPNAGDSDIYGPTSQLTVVRAQDIILSRQLCRESADEYETRERINIVTVKAYDNPISDTTRILQTLPSAYDLPYPEGDVDADIVLRTPLESDWQPTVLGYRTVVFDAIRGLYYLKYDDTKEDPYKADNVANSSVLSRWDRRSMERLLIGMGLNEASEHIQQLDTVSIADLAQMTRAHGQLAYRGQNERDLPLGFTRLDDFKHFVENQKLRLTPELFTAFGQVILGQFKPEYMTHLLSGYEMRKGRVNAVRSMRLFVKTGPHMGVTDWTPSPEDR